MPAVRTAILLINLGTPDDTSVTALRRYLLEFLSDRCVVTLPPPLWQPILRGVVLPFYAPKSAKRYQIAALPEGMPLLVYSRRLAEKLQTSLRRREPDTTVVLGMRYGRPSLRQAFEQLRALQPERLAIVPLYPQYAEATTGSSLLRCRELLSAWPEAEKPAIHTMTDYHDHPAYIDATAENIRRRRRGDHLLISFHSVPQQRIDLGSPYYEHCLQSARLIARALQLKAEAWQLVFQSKFGRAKWLEPACDKVLVNLARRGVRRVDIVCPGFAVDCLETLEEVASEYRELFVKAGGETLNYIPALNDDDTHVACLATVIKNVC